MALAWSLCVRYGAVLFRGYAGHFGILCVMLENLLNVLFAGQKLKNSKNRVFWRIWSNFHQCHNMSGLAQNNWVGRLFRHHAVLVSIKIDIEKWYLVNKSLVIASASCNDRLRFTVRMLTSACEIFVKRVHLCPLSNDAYLSNYSGVQGPCFNQLMWSSDGLVTIKIE